MRIEFSFQPLGAHIVNSSLSGSVTLTPPSGATQVMIQALTANIRMTLDGTVPTATTGFQIKAGDPMMAVPVSGAMIVKVIQESAGAVLQAQWGQWW